MSRFQRFAEFGSNFTTGWQFFGVLLLLAAGWIWAAAADMTRLQSILLGVFTIIGVFKISLLANAERREIAEIKEVQEKQPKDSSHS